MMISRKVFSLLIFLLIVFHNSPFSLSIAPCDATTHPGEGEPQSQLAPVSSVKSIKTPQGTVKCSCQTVANPESDPFELGADASSPDIEVSELAVGNSNSNEKTIEIEIHTPSADSEDKLDFDDSEAGKVEKVKHKAPITRNSFTLDGYDDAEDAVKSEDNFESSSNDRIFSTEEPPSFLSFLSAIASQAQAQQQQQEEEAEFEDEDEFVEDDGNDEPASLSPSLHSLLLNTRHPHHRFEEEEDETPSALTTAPEVNSGYKAFRSSELSASLSPHLSTKSTGTSTAASIADKGDDAGLSQKDLSEESANSYFLWDFMYGGSDKPSSMSSNFGKKREFLYLGSALDSFQGPRRRRRRRSLRGSSRQAPVYFVYPEGYRAPSQPSQNDAKPQNNVTFSKVNNNNTNENVQKRYVPPTVDPAEVDIAMQAALENAWAEYGPNGVYSPKPVVPPPPEVVAASIANHPKPAPPLQLATVTRPRLGRPPQKVQSWYYAPPRPFLYIDRIFNPFQPMSSEWDEKVASGPPPPPPEPGFFSRFMARYIDFEVNNHEAADLMRRTVFAIFVGFLVLCWIGLGVLLGVIPMKKWFAFMTGMDMGVKRIDKGKELSTRDATISELTDKILLSLEAGWLKRLEERVTESLGEGNVRKLSPQVFCCILPDEETQGMVECQVKKIGVKKGAKPQSTFKCLTGLIYNFQFGPKDEATEEEQDNSVNSKSKANDSGGGEIENESKNHSGSGNETVTVVFE